MTRHRLWGGVVVLAWVALVLPGAYGAEPSEAEARLEKALAEPTEAEFIDTPLRDVADFLEDYHQLQIVIDQSALEDAGLGSDVPISLNLKGISFESVLNLICRPKDLTWTVHDEVLLITTPEAAEQLMTTRVYLLNEQAPPAEELVKVIRTTVAPTSWSEVGGRGAAVAVSAAAGPALVVLQDDRTHRRIATLLDQLDVRAKGTPKKK